MVSKVRDDKEVCFFIYKRDIEKQVSKFHSWAGTLKQARAIVRQFGIEHYYIIRTTTKKVEFK